MNHSSPRSFDSETISKHRSSNLKKFNQEWTTFWTLYGVPYQLNFLPATHKVGLLIGVNRHNATAGPFPRPHSSIHKTDWKYTVLSILHGLDSYRSLCISTQNRNRKPFDSGEEKAQWAAVFLAPLSLSWDVSKP